jgi:CBS-domain-containing membrane protein
VATVEEATPIADVIDVLMSSPLKRVVVVDADRRVKGIISDVDVLTGIQEESRPHLLEVLAAWSRSKPGHLSTGALRGSSGKARVAADVMNREVVTIVEMASVQEAVERMLESRRKVLPVVDQEGRLTGTVGRFDLLRLLMESETAL